MGDISAAHSKLGASSYDRWGNCFGSVRECEGVVSIESEYAKEGTLAHTVCERLVKGESLEDLGELPEDMLAACKIYVDFIKGHGLLDWELWLERKFDLTAFHPAFFGTTDAMIYNSIEKHLKIVDYKHGAGVPVDIEKNGKPNGQLMYYALGALHALDLPVEKIEIVIVQPRCYHDDGPIRSRMVEPMEVMDYMEKLVADALETEKPDAPLNPGSHCRWCAAQYKCPVVHKKSKALMESPFPNSPVNPSVAYSPEKLAETLELLPMMEGFIKAVRAFAYCEATEGRMIPGWKLVDKRATRKWKGEEHEIYGLIYKQTKFRHDDLFNEKFKSPAQIEEVLSKEEFKLVEPFIEKVSSGRSLVPETDKRSKSLGNSSPFESLG